MFTYTGMLNTLSTLWLHNKMVHYLGSVHDAIKRCKMHSAVTTVLSRKLDASRCEHITAQHVYKTIFYRNHGLHNTSNHIFKHYLTQGCFVRLLIGKPCASVTVQYSTELYFTVIYFYRQ